MNKIKLETSQQMQKLSLDNSPGYTLFYILNNSVKAKITSPTLKHKDYEDEA